MKRLAVITVSFGTSVESMRKAAIDPVEEHMARTFADRRTYTAWTSGRVREKVFAERGEEHDSLETALGRVAEDGADELTVQPTCLMHGFEVRKIEEALAAWDYADATVRLGAPLLSSEQDRLALARILADELADVPSTEAVVFMGHGSAKGDNSPYEQMNDVFATLGLRHFALATIEGTLPFASVFDFLEQREPARVHLAPLMIVAGEHATVDMAGPGPESWASQLSARGYQVNPIVRGLGEYPGVRDLIADHARTAAVFDRKAARA